MNIHKSEPLGRKNCLSGKRIRTFLPSCHTTCKKYDFQDSCLIRIGCLRYLVPLIVLCIAAIVVTGCSKRFHDLPAYSPFSMGSYKNKSVGRFKSTYLADQIEAYYYGTDPGPIGITTFVNLDDLYATSSFGRMLAEQMLSELSMKGFEVIELRHSDAIQILASEGEFGLSRGLGSVRSTRELGGVVVGTYVVSPKRVYLNVRLIDPTTSRVLSAGSAEMSKTKEIAKLLKTGTFHSTLERIPVKHIGDNPVHEKTIPLDLSQKTYSPGSYNELGEQFFEGTKGAKKKDKKNDKIRY
jgi:TolB-like protein